MTDRDGDLVQHYGYMPFGNERYANNTQAFSVTNRYTGQHLDEETGLYFYGSRYYDPQLSRFIQPDSIIPSSDDSQALNRYSYCYNNPLIFTDPSGHFVVAAATAIASYIAAHATTIIASAVINAGIAAAQGGNVWKAAVAGAIAGGFGAMGIMEGMAGGALGALVTGGDPGMAAATAGIAAGVSIACGFSPISDWVGGVPDISIGQICIRDLAASTGVGALSGGVTAEIFGGDFREGAMWGAIGAAAGYVVSTYMDDFLNAVVDTTVSVLDLTGALLGDIIYGPLDTEFLRGRRAGSSTWRTIKVKAYRLMGRIGYIWTPFRNEFHCSQDFLNYLRAETIASRTSPVTHNKSPLSHSGTAAHEIGHTTQFLPIPIVGELAYYLSVAPASFVHHTIVRGIFHAENAPIISHFENDASQFGEYGGIK